MRLGDISFSLRLVHKPLRTTTFRKLGIEKTPLGSASGAICSVGQKPQDMSLTGSEENATAFGAQVAASYKNLDASNETFSITTACDCRSFNP